MKKPVGRVYILTNQAMPGLVKIGFTKNSVEERVRELFTTGVPSEFKIEFQIECRDPEGVEQAIHERLASDRHGSNREFFKMPPVEAAKIVKEIAYSISEEIFGIETELILKNKKNEYDLEFYSFDDTVREGISIRDWIQLPSLKHEFYFSKEYKLLNSECVSLWEKISYRSPQSEFSYMSSLIKKEYYLKEKKYLILRIINFPNMNATGNILNSTNGTKEKFDIELNSESEQVFNYLMKKVGARWELS